MRAGVQAEQLTIEHVRNARERVPVVGMNVCERPPNVLRAETRFDVRIISDVRRVIVIDKGETVRLPKNSERDRDQSKTDRDSESKFGAHELVILR